MSAEVEARIRAHRLEQLSKLILRLYAMAIDESLSNHVRDKAAADMVEAQNRKLRLEGFKVTHE